MSRSRSNPTIACEIHAPDATLAAGLERTVTFCLEQSPFRADLVTREIAETDATVTLHLSPEQASPDHPVWCLVCRLACLCPQARVGVLVQAADSFQPAACLAG